MAATSEESVQQERNALVVRHLDLVGHIVAEVSVRYPRHVDRGELWNAGALGLVEASRRFNPDAGIPFARYAAIRIRGAIIDSTRTRDWATRSVRRQLREVREAATNFEDAHGRAASDEELAVILGVTVRELSDRRSHGATSTLLQLDKEDADEPSLKDRVEETRRDVQPEQALEHRELIGTLSTSIQYLPPVQAEVVTRYYLNGELLQDIAADMGVTEARVSQIRSEALVAMRAYFKTMYEGVPEVDEQAPGKRARAAYLSQVTQQSTWKSRLDSGDSLVPNVAI